MYNSRLPATDIFGRATCEKGRETNTGADKSGLRSQLVPMTGVSRESGLMRHFAGRLSR
jgi:hypothetical protein